MLRDVTLSCVSNHVFWHIVFWYIARLILCASRPRTRDSLSWLSIKSLNIGDGVYVFALAQPAASYECVDRICLFMIEFSLQARNLCGSWNRLSASNTRH